MRLGDRTATRRRAKGSPLTRDRAFVARIPTSPHTRGEVIGCAVDSFAGAQAVAIQYNAFGDEILAYPVC